MKLIDYGKIAKTHGLSGGLKIVPFSGETAALKTLKRIFVKSPGGLRPGSFDIIRKNIQKKSAVIQLSGIDSCDSASAFCGAVVMVAESDLPETGEGEYYNFQIVGLAVFSPNGEEIGTVSSVLQNGMQSVLVVLKTSGGESNGSKELLVPMVEKFIAGIDTANSRLVLRNTAALDRQS